MWNILLYFKHDLKFKTEWSSACLKYHTLIACSVFFRVYVYRDFVEYNYVIVGKYWSFYKKSLLIMFLLYESFW